MRLDTLIERISEHMELDELVYYLEEKEDKETIVGCLMPLILLNKSDLEEDYPWLV